MSAAALTFLGGGNLEQSLAAASMALQGSLGMICDPIGNRVEAPCLGKNVLAATNAVSCANMALADYQHLIPLDQVIEAMDKVQAEAIRASGHVDRANGPDTCLHLIGARSTSRTYFQSGDYHAGH